MTVLRVSSSISIPPVSVWRNPSGRTCCRLMRFRASRSERKGRNSSMRSSASPGRPGLALDLMEEFRPFLSDRLALNLINRQQVRPDGFRQTETGGIEMDDDTRKTVITAYQKRKQDTITHPFLGEETTVGLLIHLQARLLARPLRGALDAYPPFVWK